MPVGTNIPLVIQAGKWRRKISIPTVTAGTNTPLTAAQTSLPSTEGSEAGDPADNIPYIAVVTGAEDAAECVLLKMGVAQNEFTDPGGTGRINFYLGAATGSGSGYGEIIDGSTPGESVLFGSQASVDAYDLLMFPCQGAPSDTVAESTANQALLANYANAGGHIYDTHYSYEWLYKNTAFANTVSWDVEQTLPNNDTGFVVTTYPQGAQLAQWLKDVGASTTLGQIPLNALRWDQDGVLGATQAVLYVDYPSAAVTTVMQLTFNTPLTAAPANQCGQVLYNEYHVFDQSSEDQGEVFPAACPTATALTPQEELLAYSLFGLSTVGSAQSAPTVLVAITNNPSEFVQGDLADTFTINVTNTSTTSPTTPSLKLTAVLPSGLTVANMVGSTPTTGWTCSTGTLTCTRTTGLSASTSDAITLTVSVATTIPVGTSETVSATASGGGIASSVTNHDIVVIEGETTTSVTLVSPSSEDWSDDTAVTITAQLTWLGAGATPTGAVQIGSASLNGSFSTTTCGGASSDTITCQATYTPTIADVPGYYTITATTAGDSNYAGSISTQNNNFTITLATSGTSVGSSQNPSVVGQQVTFTATIDGENGLVVHQDGKLLHGAVNKGLVNKAALNKEVGKRGFSQKGQPQPLIPAGGITGTVTWSANTGCSATAVSGNPGTSLCITSALPQGTDTITATYSGDNNHSGSAGTLSGGQVVNLTSTSIAVTSVSPANEVYGQDSQFTITAVLSWTATGAAPTASDVTIGGTGPSSYSATTCGAPSSDTLTCTATYTPTGADAIGFYTESATFSGDTNYTGSSSTQTNNFIITQAISATSVTSSQNPSTFGQQVTFTATINGEYGLVKGRTGSSAGRGFIRNSVGSEITGTVTWSTNTGCGTTQLTAGTAICLTSSLLGGGARPITANYSGDSNHTRSSGTLAGGQVVNPAGTTTTLNSPLNPSTYGQAVSFSANVTSSVGTPNGSVQFQIDGANFGPLVTLVAGYASSGSTSKLTVGNHTVTAKYAGNTNYGVSPGTLLTGQEVDPAGTSTSLISSANPSSLGTKVTFTAAVAVQSPGTGTPAGTVQFFDGLNSLGTETLSKGEAKFTTSALGLGPHSITAQYLGNSNYTGSTSQPVPQSVQSLPLRVSPPTLSYGTVPIGKSVKNIVTVENPNPTAVTIGTVTLTVTQGDASQFQLEHVCAPKLAAGATCTIAVIFTPDAVGPDAATVNIPTSASATPIEVPITAAGGPK